jgi:hypothetical protein
MGHSQTYRGDRRSLRNPLRIRLPEIIDRRVRAMLSFRDVVAREKGRGAPPVL